MSVVPGRSEGARNLEGLAAPSGIALALIRELGHNNAMQTASVANYGWRLSVPMLPSTGGRAPLRRLLS